MRAPLADAEYRAINEAINGVIRDDHRIRDLIRVARAAQTREAFDAAVVEGAELLAQSKAGAELLGFVGCVDVIRGYATADFPTGPDGELQPVLASLRVKGVPGIDGRPVWVLLNDDDVAAMRMVVAPGQVWIRSDLVKSDDWPRIRAIASDAVQRMLGLVRPPGRRKGSQNRRRREVLSQILATPGMSDDAIHQLGVDAGIWDAELNDYPLIRQRVRLAREDAKRIKS